MRTSNMATGYFSKLASSNLPLRSSRTFSTLRPSSQFLLALSKNSSVTNSAKSSEDDSEEEADDLAEYLEYLNRITPTTLPEWMD
jgi:hypothetical protein